ncbi:MULTISPECIES: C40 family peptidase [Aerococcus]|uniref:LysM peptidoglycan-binding domain-containing protein n=1 Tax=Aerococcus sanguinicola TaxID=119206 RepID=A0A5N1GUG4_9LACT|nr:MULTISPECIES: C40 family peptidase [Aerococcus]KAA9302230.1 LysM peptidoglycan-binding domain-containing protein [Aerococcus sanguinicola]MDK6368981.1 LysM peptidoglycan-binding domain-containing protein [Aerococcus sp. UMB9870]MDK6678884.1 LysM peptidoglycan-binding domain-containing protein [Aerococcus sp. UMB8608]MDK6686798.1 LysM peptidoglycan-binding domain-containing protein [Aerococcus sp. UMB8623]MDK6939542.1 LysM peptidoglycan-binding domain-containing protein [Aerococcus sp. UMB84
MSKLKTMVGTSLATTTALLAFAQTASADELYKVNAGDTLSAIANSFGTSVDAIAKENNIKDVNHILVGQQFNIPTETVKIDTQASQAASQAADAVYHVQAGDTLNQIAAKFNTTADALRQLNQISGDLILVGQQLKVKGQVEAAQTTQADQGENGKVVADTVATEAPVVEKEAHVITINGNTYTVKAGDTLPAIAQAAGTSVESLRALNGLSSDFIYAGQVLVLYPEVEETAPVQASVATYQAAPEDAEEIVIAPAAKEEVVAQPAKQEVKEEAVVAQPASHSQENAQAEEAKAQADAQAAEAQRQQEAQAAEAQRQAEAQAAEAQRQQEAQAAEAQRQQEAQQAEAKRQQEAAQAQKQQQQQAQQNNQGNQNVVATARQYKGVPYVWGGKTPNGFDCSGFTNYVYREATGQDIGGWTVPQESAGPTIAVNQAQAGDLYFWGNHGSSYHVALATDNQGGYIHAPAPGQTVTESNVQYYAPHFAVSMQAYQ